MRFRKMKMRTSAFVAIACLAGSFIGLGKAEGNYITTVSITNGTAQAATDLFLTFSNSGGMITMPTILTSPAAAGVASITAGTNDITINWTVGLPVNNTVTFNFLSTFGPATYASGSWSYPVPFANVPTDATRDKIMVTSVQTPEPASMLLMSFPIAAGLIASCIARRRRLP